MKRTMISGLMVVSLVLGGMTLATAGNGPGQGKGYGGAPQSEAERAARQAACLEKNGGVCPNGGPRGAGECKGQGQGKGQGKGQRRGACDGTGPRAGTGNCPANGATQK
jgi:hypothetical protein